jgi:hypothetical protein
MKIKSNIDFEAIMERVSKMCVISLAASLLFLLVMWLMLTIPFIYLDCTLVELVVVFVGGLFAVSYFLFLFAVAILVVLCFVTLIVQRKDPPPISHCFCGSPEELDKHVARLMSQEENS